jgi:AraC-like DNA-binding protein
MPLIIKMVMGFFIARVLLGGCCTGEEIASVLDVNYSTLERACKREKECTFSDYIAEKKLGGKASLRRNQWKLAENGNATMLIWPGKNYHHPPLKAKAAIQWLKRNARFVPTPVIELAK